MSARAGLKASLELLFRVSTLIQLIFGAFAVIRAFFLPSANIEAVVGGLPLIAVVLHLIHYVAIAKVTISRRPYPWSLFKWTFPLATCAYYAPTVFELGRIATQFRFSLFALALTVISVLPGIFMVVLLWSPRRVGTPAAFPDSPGSTL